MEVTTVDAVQGREADVVLLSCVRAAGELGFLVDERRMNVGLTRARFSMWVLCHARTLRESVMWKSLLDHARDRRVLVDAKQLLTDT